MIKSYKFVLIILLVFILLFWLFKPYVSFENNEPFETHQLLIIGFTPLFFLGISVLLQRIVLSVIHSDSAKTDLEIGSEDKTWKTAFLVNLLFGVVVFLGAVVFSLLKYKIALVSNYRFSEDLAVVLFILAVTSFAISTFFRIKNTVWEVNKFVGLLMIFLSIFIFAVAVYLPAIHFFYLSQTSEMPTEVINSESVSTEEVYEVADELDERDYDFYSFNEMDFSDVATGGL